MAFRKDRGRLLIAPLSRPDCPSMSHRISTPGTPPHLGTHRPALPILVMIESQFNSSTLLLSPALRKFSWKVCHLNWDDMQSNIHLISVLWGHLPVLYSYKSTFFCWYLHPYKSNVEELYPLLPGCIYFSVNMFPFISQQAVLQLDHSDCLRLLTTSCGRRSPVVFL